MNTSVISNPIEAIAERWSLSLKQIRNAAEQARSKRQQLKEICEKEKFLSEDTSVVVFGSLARDEYTTGSDADWTLLIDGEANSDHLKVVQKIKSSIKEIFKEPNPMGAFGGMTFSHQLRSEEHTSELQS